MSDISDDNQTLLIGGSLGGLFLTAITFIMRKYIKSSKCHNVLGNIEILTNAIQEKKETEDKEQQTEEAEEINNVVVEV
jgi:NAD/NADP transhydrogenase beta subunit